MVGVSERYVRAHFRPLQKVECILWVVCHNNFDRAAHYKQRKPSNTWPFYMNHLSINNFLRRNRCILLTIPVQKEFEWLVIWIKMKHNTSKPV